LTQFLKGLTALHYACDRGHLDIIKLLVEKGADVNALVSYPLI
jgi:ankyrin repeat protein